MFCESFWSNHVSATKSFKIQFNNTESQINIITNSIHSFHHTLLNTAHREQNNTRVGTQNMQLNQTICSKTLWLTEIPNEDINLMLDTIMGYQDSLVTFH